MVHREGTVSRETDETAIEVTIDLDGSGEAAVETGIGFFDHMLESLAVHGLFNLEVTADGDLEIDEHHTVEDVGIALGRAIDDALGDRAGIERYADRRVPLDEAVASVVVDLGGRPLYRFEGSFSHDRVGDVTSQLASHFWRSVSTNAGITAHASIEGANGHHEIEALFKAFARALDDATRIDDRRSDAASTKGTLTE